MLYGDLQLKSSEVGLTKAGLTVTLPKYWLRKYNIYTRVSKTKAKSPPPPHPPSKDIFKQGYSEYNIYTREPKTKGKSPPPPPPVKRYLQAKIK